MALRDTGAESVVAESTRGALLLTSLPTSSALRFGGRFVDAACGRAALRAPLSLRGAGFGFGAEVVFEGLDRLSAPVLMEERMELRSCILSQQTLMDRLDARY